MIDTIFTPRFQHTDDIATGLEYVEANAWLIENVLIMPKHEAWMRRDVRVRRAAGTTRIEGASLNEAEVNDLVKKGHPGKLSEDERANLNAIQAYEFVDYLSDQPDVPIDELVVRELNRYILRGAPETVTPGAYRKGQNKVGKFDPPDQGDVPTLMRSFAEWLRSEQEELNPVLKAGIAHIHLVAIHPFWDGNGRTARALATLILQRSRLHFKKLLSLEAFIFSVREDYFTAIEKTLGASFSPQYDATPWLEFFVRSLLAHSSQLAKTLTEWRQQIDRIYRAAEALNINHRQADGLTFALRTGRITRADYLEITGASPVTASRDLDRLVRAGWLIARGKTRARVYEMPKEGQQTSLFEQAAQREAQKALQGRPAHQS
jgi:Fic family protein